MISVTNAYYRYPQSNGYVIEDFTHEFLNSEITAITGKNGSGKSTLGLIVSKLATPELGTVQIDGKVGIVFQDPSTQVLFETVKQDLEFMLVHANVPKSEWDERINGALERVGMLDKKDQNPQKFSGGEKQRIAIACALVLVAQNLVFDEASAHLDPAGKKLFLKICKEEAKRSASVVLITNDLNELEIASKRIDL